MATDQLINKAQGDAIISGLTAIKNAINDQPVPTQVEDVVADAFDVGVSYVPGDYCIYENKLYVCDVAHHGAWDGNDFTLTTVGAVLESLNNDLNSHNWEFIGNFNELYPGSCSLDYKYVTLVITNYASAATKVYQTMSIPLEVLTRVSSQMIFDCNFDMGAGSVARVRIIVSKTSSGYTFTPSHMHNFEPWITMYGVKA